MQLLNCRSFYSC
ncbi:unnamed protein product [Linum tenue]|uniref:Uncharacterized protein n=1 Tax=Linum tenue TaxID=586396 RepID=A0AAV0HGE1_9ROSI|nr:unnamed protein product [Linum tenue]